MYTHTINGRGSQRTETPNHVSMIFITRIIYCVTESISKETKHSCAYYRLISSHVLMYFLQKNIYKNTALC